MTRTTGRKCDECGTFIDVAPRPGGTRPITLKDGGERHFCSFLCLSIYAGRRAAA